MPRNPKYDQFQPEGHHNEENPQSTTKMPGKPQMLPVSLSQNSMAMEMDKIELMVELQVFTHIHDQRAVHRQFIPDTQ